jgi:hypothetical protein
MAEYVNRYKLVKELECGIRAGNYEKGYDGYAHINSIDDCVDTVKDFDKADVVEREKINKAIEELKAEKGEIACLFDDDWDDGLELILEILKRNIGESK